MGEPIEPNPPDADLPVRDGDVVLVRDSGLVARSIAFGAERHYGRYSPHIKWTHVAIVYDATAQGAVRIAEATSRDGVHRALLAKYRSRDTKIVHMGVAEHDWDQVKRFLDSTFGREGYGWVTYLGLFLYDLMGTRLCLQLAGTTICSGLVCDALTRAGIIWPRPPYACTPADIDAHLVGTLHLPTSESRGRP